MFMVVDSVANWIEAVVVADVETVSEVYNICHAFTSDAFYRLSGETEGQVFGDSHRNFNVRFGDYSRCRFWSRSL